MTDKNSSLCYRPLPTLATILLIAAFSKLAGAQSTLDDGASIDPLVGMPDAEAGRLKEIVANLVRSSVPEHYQNDKDWGHQKRIYAGVKLWRDGWKLETKRRWKVVNHGRWTRYRIDLVDPDENVKIELDDLRWLPNGRAEFKLTLAGKMHCHVRRSLWNLGVQLWSFHVDADAEVSIAISGSIGIQMDYVNIPPDVLLAPVIDSAAIGVSRFEVTQISEIRGDFAEGIGDALEGLLRKEVIKRQETKLVEKMNRQIVRKQDSLRFSIGDWLARLLATQPNDG